MFLSNEDFLNSLEGQGNFFQTGFGENAYFRARRAIREDAPFFSRAQMYNAEPFQARRARFMEIEKTGMVDPDIFRWNRDNEDRLVEQIREKYPDQAQGLFTNEELEKQVAETYKPLRLEEDKVFQEQSMSGAAGEFLGNAVIALDPYYAISYFTGYGTMAGGMKMGQALMTIGAQEAALEVGAQLMIKDFKDDIGVDYSAAEMAVNVGFSTILPMGIAGGALGVKKLTAKHMSSIFKKYDPEAKFPAIDDAPPGADARKVIDADEGKQASTDKQSPKADVDYQKGENPYQATDDPVVVKAKEDVTHNWKKAIADPSEDPATVVAREKKLVDDLMEKAEGYKDRPYEHAALYTKKGEPIGEYTSGETSALSFPPGVSSKAEYMIHNHPGDTPTSFSPADVAWALSHNVKSIYAVNPDGSTYRMSFKDLEWFNDPTKGTKLADVEYNEGGRTLRFPSRVADFMRDLGEGVSRRKNQAITEKRLKGEAPALTDEEFHGTYKRTFEELTKDYPGVTYAKSTLPERVTLESPVADVGREAAIKISAITKQKEDVLTYLKGCKYGL